MTVEICLGTACHVHGASSLLQKLKSLESAMNIEISGTPCLDACGNHAEYPPPVLRIDGEFYYGLVPEQLETLLRRIQEEKGGRRET